MFLNTLHPWVKARVKTITAGLVLLIVLSLVNAAAAETAYEHALRKYKAEDYQGAISVLSDKKNKNSGDLNLLGWAFFRLNETSFAISSFEGSVKLNPKAHNSFCGLGFAFLKKNTPEKALANFKKATHKNTKDVECSRGLAMSYEALGDIEKALSAYNKILAIDKQNIAALKKIEELQDLPGDGEEREFSVEGDYFRVKDSKGARPLFLKGVNLGLALPGNHPTEFPEDPQAYTEWFSLISGMNANVIRVYTILPPQFYRALKSFNRSRPGNERLFLIQGIWVDLPENGGFREKGYVESVNNGIQDAVDAVHGKAIIPVRPGHSSGVYRHDVSEYVIGFIFGREWEPPAVIDFNSKNEIKSFSGDYLSIADSTPMEAWLAEKLNYLIGYEDVKYKKTRPVAFMNWPPLDPLFHISESSSTEEKSFLSKLGEGAVQDNGSAHFDEDAVSLDETRFKNTDNFRAGIFASYHAYPYYPDFLRNEEAYSGAPGRYYNYLADLKKHYKGIPLLISEYGIPTSRGIARYHADGLGHGGHTEDSQAEGLTNMTIAIRDAGCAGAIAFSWLDEWFKASWMTRDFEENDLQWYNAEDPEESYGILGLRPLKYEGPEWNEKHIVDQKTQPPLQVLNDGHDGSLTLKRVYADSDAGYLYLRVDVAGEADWEHSAYLIAIDTYSDSLGDHKLPLNLGIESPVGFEFVILLHGEKSRILTDDKYVRRVFDKSLSGRHGLSGYIYNRDFRLMFNADGKYEEAVNAHRRRLSREGRIYPEMIYNASILRQGDLKDGADFTYHKDKGFYEVRIPWALLNFSDPSKKEIIFSENERRKTEGIKLLAVSYKPKNTQDSIAEGLEGNMNASDILPSNLSSLGVYKWDDWEKPEYSVHLKKSYSKLREIFSIIKDPAVYNLEQ